MIDSYSIYKNIIRNFIIRKHNLIVNSYKLPKISKIIYSFKLYKLEDLDDVQIYNYIYFFKFFFGRRGFLTKYKSFFKLGIWSYTFRVSMYVYNPRQIYNNLYLLFREYLSFIDDSFLNLGFFTKLAKIYYILVKDLNFFSEKKTNIGLFNLYTPLLVLLYLNSNLALTNKMLPRNMKLNEINLW